MEPDAVIWTDKKTGGFYPKIFPSAAFKKCCEVKRYMCVTVLKQASVTMCARAAWESAVSGVQPAGCWSGKLSAWSLSGVAAQHWSLHSSILHFTRSSHLSVAPYCLLLLSPRPGSASPPRLSAAVSYCLSVHLPELCFLFISNILSPISPVLSISSAFTLKGFFFPVPFPPPGVSLSLHLTMSVFFSWLCLFFSPLSSPITNVSRHLAAFVQLQICCIRSCFYKAWAIKIGLVFIAWWRTLHSVFEEQGWIFYDPEILYWRQPTLYLHNRGLFVLNFALRTLIGSVEFNESNLVNLFPL